MSHEVQLINIHFLIFFWELKMAKNITCVFCFPYDVSLSIHFCTHCYTIPSTNMQKFSYSKNFLLYNWRSLGVKKNLKVIVWLLFLNFPCVTILVTKKKSYFVFIVSHPHLSRKIFVSQHVQVCKWENVLVKKNFFTFS